MGLVVIAVQAPAQFRAVQLLQETGAILLLAFGFLAVALELTGVIILYMACVGFGRT